MRRKRALGLDDLHQSELERVLDKAFAGHDDNVGAIVALQTLSSGIRAAFLTYRAHVVLGFPTRVPSDEAFNRLCLSLPEMQSFTVYDGPGSACLNISGSQLCCLEGCTQLTRLDLRGAETSFKRGEIMEDASLPVSIVDLSLPPVPIRHILREGLGLALCNLQLTKLVCHGSEFYPPSHLTNLQELQVDCDVSLACKTFLKHGLQRLTSLTSLLLSGPGERQGYKQAARTSVVAPASLLKLHITGFISPRSLDSLLRCVTGLQTLSLTCACNSTNVLSLSDVPANLRSLELYNSHCDISKLRTPGLQELICINSMSTLNDKSIRVIAGLSHLTSLHLERITRFGDPRPLGSLPALRHLTLANNCAICHGLLNKDSLQQLESFRLHSDREAFDSSLAKYVRQNIVKLTRLTRFDTNFVY